MYLCVFESKIRISQDLFENVLKTSKSFFKNLKNSFSFLKQAQRELLKNGTSQKRL